jgi:hypothetical protein
MHPAQEELSAKVIKNSHRHIENNDKYIYIAYIKPTVTLPVRGSSRSNNSQPSSPIKTGPLFWGPFYWMMPMPCRVTSGSSPVMSTMVE